ncbi:MAG: hypothetical protein AAF934_11900 [Bacteroidota bacterium]
MKHILAKTTEKKQYSHKAWDSVPAKKPNCFDLKTTATGAVVCTISFPETCDSKLLNLIAAAPELYQIAEMYHDFMLGNEAEKTMVFSIVKTVLSRV